MANFRRWVPGVILLAGSVDSSSSVAGRGSAHETAIRYVPGKRPYVEMVVAFERNYIARSVSTPRGKVFLRATWWGQQMEMDDGRPTPMHVYYYDVVVNAPRPLPIMLVVADHGVMELTGNLDGHDVKAKPDPRRSGFSRIWLRGGRHEMVFDSALGPP